MRIGPVGVGPATMSDLPRYWVDRGNRQRRPRTMTQANRPGPSSRLRRLTLTAAAGLVAVGALIGGDPAGAAPWAPAATATIHPGVQLFTDGAQCTANFIYGDGTNV